MKTLDLVFYLIYRYYSKGPKKDISYFSTLTVLSFLTFIHILQILLLFNYEKLLPGFVEPSRRIKYVMIFLFLAPIALFYSLLFQRKRIETLVFSEPVINKGKSWFIFYISLSLLTLFFLILVKRGVI